MPHAASAVCPSCSAKSARAGCWRRSCWESKCSLSAPLRSQRVRITVFGRSCAFWARSISEGFFWRRCGHGPNGFTNGSSRGCCFCRRLPWVWEVCEDYGQTSLAHTRGDADRCENAETQRPQRELIVG